MNGIAVEADFFFLGRCMKHGPRNKRKMMMFKRSCGRIEDRRRDAHSVISEGYSLSTKNRFLHYDFKNLDYYIKRYNWYATREMQDYIDFTGVNPHRSTRTRLFWRSGKRNLVCITKCRNTSGPGRGLFITMFFAGVSWMARKVWCTAFWSATGTGCWWMPKSLSTKKPAANLKH